TTIQVSFRYEIKMPKLLKNMSKRRINQLISKEIQNAHASRKTKNQSKVDLVLQYDCGSESTESHLRNDCLMTVTNVNEPYTLEYIEFHRDDESNSTNNLKEDSRLWLSENSIPQQAANDLIAIFRSH
ncbi:hypothetical protein PV327_011350, partial [Microctonus hyperodae]